MEKIKRGLSKIKEEQAKISKEVKERTISYIMAAFGLVAGLAWNEAIKDLIDQIFPRSGSGVLIKFTYAIVVTVFIVFITIYLVKFIEKKEAQ